MVLENSHLVDALVNASITHPAFKQDKLYGDYPMPPSQILILKKLNFCHIPAFRLAGEEEKFRNPFLVNDIETEFIQQNKLSYLSFLQKYPKYEQHNSISEHMHYNNYLFPQNISHDDMPLLQITLAEIESCQRFKM